MRNLASIREINNIQPIMNADNIEVATVDGWHVVVSKEDDFKIGNKVIYIEIDSLLPPIDMFEFMKKRKYRVRTIKLRGQISQGLIMPLSILPHKYQNSKVGTDVTEILNITKYDPETELENKLINHKKHSRLYKFFMKYGWFRKMFHSKHKKASKSTFPNWIVKTDEERVQNLVSLFMKEKTSNTLFSVTEKIDGCSGTYAVKKDSKGKYEYFICSRNHVLNKGKEENKSSHHYYNISQKYKLEEVLNAIAHSMNANKVVIQGEIIGNGIQNNKYEISGFDFYVFNLIIDGEKYDIKTMVDILNYHNLKCVPMIDEIILMDTIDEIVDYSVGKSKLLPKQKREGIVLRNIDKNISFKVINPKFLLEEKED